MASDDTKALVCAYKPCKNKFIPRTHNQKYCSDECCKIATNLKIKEKYYKKKARLSGVEFKCETKGCNQILSMYTSETLCEVCKAKQRTKARKEIWEMLGDN